MKNKGINAEIRVKANGETIIFEMHSFIKRFLGTLAGSLCGTTDGTNWNSEVSEVESRAQAKSTTFYGPYIMLKYTESPFSFTSAVTASSSVYPENVDWDVMNNINASYSCVKNPDKTTTITFFRDFRNKSDVTKIIKSCQLLGSCDNNVCASDIMNVSVPANQIVEITYAFTFAKNITDSQIEKFLFTHSLKYHEIGTAFAMKDLAGVEQNVGWHGSGAYIFLGNYFIHADITRPLGIIIGESDAPILGTESCLRAEIPANKLQFYPNRGSISAPVDGFSSLCITRMIKNISADPITINEVAIYSYCIGLSSLNKIVRMAFIDVLKEPITLLAGESADIKIDMKIA